MRGFYSLLLLLWFIVLFVFLLPSFIFNNIASLLLVFSGRFSFCLSFSTYFVELYTRPMFPNTLWRLGKVLARQDQKPSVKEG